jgi:hypothetical protein
LIVLVPEFPNTQFEIVRFPATDPLISMREVLRFGFAMTNPVKETLFVAPAHV